ncbi:MAG: haloalkane dehalogenase [Kiloniellales bacterium]|nr:haloalkane dehalogenase [Kiloniellales bacterium]
MKPRILFPGLLGLLTLVAAPLAAQDAKPSYRPPLSADFPYESRFVEVLGSRIYYIEAGQGAPILLLHGNPTSSYLWRNVIPFLEPHGRVIAPDLIGFGRSDKPDIGYTFVEHRAYVAGFIAALGLEGLTLVLHDWGSALGFDYAMRSNGRVRAIAFMEALVPPVFPMESFADMGPYEQLFRDMRDPAKGPIMVIRDNAFIEQILPSAVLRDLTPEEMAAYRAPFAEVSARKPILVWPNQIPIGGEPEEVAAIVESYGAWLRETEIPLLHLYASPGALNPPEVAAWLAGNLRNIETAFVGGGLHYIQEDQPEAIGRALADWLRRTGG